MCPHCRTMGNLILHGFLKTKNGDIRGRRIFCSNRGKRKGCGHTYSHLKAETLAGRCITAMQFWTFLWHFVESNNKKESLTQSGFDGCESTVYQFFRLFKQNQSHIRQYLLKSRAPPDCPEYTDPVIKTIKHLKAFSTGEISPIAQFQVQFQVSFLPNKVLPALLSL